ncbi:MAG: DGQHR domain-containing protein [Clostridium butyricum]|uniref:DGQHR domain-containing protein n=1 Tax=Clostridium butyricum TaxID=1492 RepID=UPI0013708FDC|nr:DGQHR domain-containing protein [Clostridium butyricum]MDU1005302.1 DGQHR domain-containing protein [Clostridium butyricum]MZI79964.1 DGQHR domain-containing protein [Clostridium butyricum]
MKKIKLMTIKQKGKVFYSMICNPRDLIKLVDVPAPKTGQKAQRPWLEKKVKEISEYVSGRARISEDKGQEVKAKGIIPNSPILNIKYPMEVVNEGAENFLIFPESDEEYKKYFGCIDIIDGQHRLISFMDKYRDIDFKDDEVYEMSFNMFVDLTINEIRELFMITNDKQEKMEQNVLREMKKSLNLLSSKEDKLYDLVISLNEETISPLKDKIIIGGNKVSNGFKLTQVSKILDKSKSYELISKQNETTQIQLISNYLKGWQNVYNSALVDNKHTLGKITGLRYMMYIFPYVCEILKELRQSLDEKNVEDIIRKLYSITHGEAVFEDDKIKLAFRGESATISLAKNNGNMLKNECMKENSIFDPLSI